MNTSNSLEKSKQYCLSQRQGKMKYAEPDYAIEVPEKCDLCHKNIAEMDFYADAMIPGCHQWGFICQECIAARRLTFSPENGLLLQKQANAEPGMAWLVVAGQIDEPAGCTYAFYDENGDIYEYLTEHGRRVTLY